jgi:hypothetical protein
MKNPLYRSKSYLSGWNLMKRVQIQLLGEKSCIRVLFCKESIKPNVFTWNSNSLNVRCFHLSSQSFLFYNLTLQSNPRSLLVFMFCNLGFLYVLLHIFSYSLNILGLYKWILQASFILSQAVLVGLATSWLPPLQDTPSLPWPTHYKCSNFWYLVCANLMSFKLALFSIIFVHSKP